MKIFKNNSKRMQNYIPFEFQNKKLWEPPPVEYSKRRFIRRPDINIKLHAAFLDDRQNVLLIGPPGCGKNTLAYDFARERNRPLYVQMGNQDLRKENIVCFPIMTSGNTIEYVLSPLAAAMKNGGDLLFDEFDKNSVAVFSALAEVLDDRRALSSEVANITINAHEDFCFIACGNENGMNYLPDYIMERMIQIHVPHPDNETLEKILNQNLPRGNDHWIRIFLNEFKDYQISPRAAIKVLTFAYRLSKANKQDKPSEQNIIEYLNIAKKTDKATKEAELTVSDKNEMDSDDFLNSLFN